MKSYEPFFGGHLMEWFSDRLSHDFGIEFLSISSLWIFVDTGLILGSNLFYLSEKISKIIISKISKFRILEKFQKSKIFGFEIFLIHSQERLWYKICGMIRPCHSFPRNTWVSALPWGTATASGYSVRIFGFGLPVLEIQEVILCVICVSFKNSLFFEANYRFDKHSGFHVCLAKTFSITLCWRTQVWFKRWAAQKTDWILISSILVFFRIHHGKSNKMEQVYGIKSYTS